MLALKGADVGGALASKHQLEKAGGARGDVEMLESEGKLAEGEKQRAAEAGELMQDREPLETMQEREAVQMAHSQLQPVEADGLEINANTTAGRDSGMYDDVAGSPYPYEAGHDSNHHDHDHDHHQIKAQHQSHMHDQPPSISSMSSHDHEHEHQHLRGTDQQQHDDLVREDGEAQVTLAMGHTLPVGMGSV